MLINLPLHQFIPKAWFLLIGLSCGNPRSTPNRHQVWPKSVAKIVYTQSILSELDPEEMFDAKILDQLIPFLEEQRAMITGLFTPVYLEEFAPFSRLKPDEFLVMIAWETENTIEIGRMLSRSLSALKNNIKYSTRFFEAITQQKVHFSQPGFYAHKMGNESRRTVEHDQSGQPDNQWIFREIVQHTSKVIEPKILHISRHESYEDWTTSILGNYLNTSGSIIDAMNQHRVNGQVIASQLFSRTSSTKSTR